MKETQSYKGKFKAIMNDLPTPAVIFRAHRRWRHTDFVTQVDHEDIVEHVLDDGRMSSRYSFMVLMSCAIAILGLLLSSPAVIIGAMLISPLMGPIMSLGFSLCILDYKQMKKALAAIVIGFFLSVLISYFIVQVSPLTDPTPEIMARTKPNLFDLMVAIFSGLAGGYATIKQKGAAIVGVSIATALMPPLAVVGYGIATESWHIAQGATFLFMTNLLAISLSVTGLAKWYGFGSHNGRAYTFFQAGMIVCVFILLSIPLGVSLMNIAQQTYVTKTTKAEISKYFEETNSRLSNFSITFSKSDDVSIDGLVVTDVYLSNASSAIKEILENSLSRPINLSLDQIVIAKEEQKKIELVEQSTSESVLTNTIQAELPLRTGREEMARAIEDTIFFPLRFFKISVKKNEVFIYPRASKGVNLTVLKAVEDKLAQRFPEWSVFVVPPAQALPFVYFNIGENQPVDLEADKVDNIIWALQRWEIADVAIIGFASSSGEFQRFNNTSLAYRRARAVADSIEAAGLNVEIRSEYTSFDQKRKERNFGINSFHRVEVRLSKEGAVLNQSEEEVERNAPN